LAAAEEYITTAVMNINIKCLLRLRAKQLFFQRAKEKKYMIESSDKREKANFMGKIEKKDAKIAVII
jgi:hypothetical protein